MALTVSDHHDHEAVLKAVAGLRLGLAGHAAFESYSVLTRLPGSARRTPATVARLLAENFPHTRYLGDRASAALLAGLHERGIAGGSVYDAVVGATAVEHGLPLATRDRRAMRTYQALEVDVRLIG